MSKIKRKVGIILLLVGASSFFGCDKEVEPLDTIRFFREISLSGLDIDKELFSKTVEPFFKITHSYRENLEGNESKALVNFFLENVGIQYISKAKYNWLMVNQELVESPDKLKDIDVVLCKSKHCSRLMADYRTRYGLQYKIVYIRFSSIIGEISLLPKDYDLVFHGAGKSIYKNTDSVLDAWLAHPELPKLILTCVTPMLDPQLSCGEQILKPRLEQIQNSINIVAYGSYLTKEQLREIQDKAGIYMVPSLNEGYGHYINEGRARESIIITTDAGPMNEMVEDGVSGFLVPEVKGELANKFSLEYKNLVKPEAIALAVKKAQSLTLAQKITMGQKSRQKFLEDTKFFENRMKELWEQLSKGNEIKSDILD